MGSNRGRRAASVRRSMALGLAVVAMAALLAACGTPTGISGVVTAGGVARLGVEVAAYDSGSPAAPVAVTVTAADGSYSLTLAPGSYDVRLGRTTWFDGTPIGGPVATAVIVTDGVLAPVSADTVLATGALSGSVINGSGSGISGVDVRAVSATGSREVVVASTTTNGAGAFAFALDALPVGDYVVRFAKSGQAIRWSGFAAEPSSAAVYTVAAGATTPGASGVLTGASRSISGQVTNGAVPVAGAVVRAISTVSDVTIATATTDALGEYRVADLAPATYWVLIEPPAPYLAQAAGTRSDPDWHHSVPVDVRFGNGSLAPERVAVCDPAVYHPGVDLHGQVLTARDLRGCDLSGADLSGADLRDTDLTGSSLPAAQFDAAILRRTVLVGADLADAVLDGADARSANLTGSSLVGASLVGADARNAIATDSAWAGAFLQGIRLAGSTLTGVSSGSLTGTPTDLPTDWLLAAGHLLGPGADLRNADLRDIVVPGAVLSGADLRNANLDRIVAPGAVLSGARLDLTRFEDADLTGAIVGATFLSGTNLGNADLAGASFFFSALVGVDLGGADLTNADLQWVSLNGVNVDAADLTGADLARLSTLGIGGTPILSPPYTLVKSHIVGPQVNLSNNNLANENLNGRDLTGVVLAGCTCNNMSLVGADLTGADLTGANLTGSDLSGAVLTGATTTTTNFTGAVAPSIRSGGVVGFAPPGYALVAGYFVGPTADLTGANLAGANLAGRSLIGAVLANATFTGATGSPTGGASAAYSLTTCPDTTVVSAPTTCVGRGFAA